MMTSRPGALAALLALGAALPAAVHAQNALEKLQIHGYLTQGFAESSDLAQYGITTEATADYRNAALQFRYSLTDADNFVVQIQHRRLGTSGLSALENDVMLNWGFFQHRFGTGTAVKAGKLPMPRGALNEVRSVGTVLPFYRAAAAMYEEGFETFDGAQISHSLDVGGGWSVDATALGGGFTYKNVVATPADPLVINARMNGLYGGQLWLNTPIPGVRLGVTGLRWRGGKWFPGDQTPSGPESQWLGTLDASHDRFTLRAEFNNVAIRALQMQSYYWQGGVRLTDKLTVNAQTEYVDQRQRAFPMPRTRERRDAALGLSYAASTNFVLKLEQHAAKGYLFDSWVNPTGAAARSGYTIASVSTSF
jgi:hypothetical protein